MLEQTSLFIYYIFYDMFKYIISEYVIEACFFLIGYRFSYMNQGEVMQYMSLETADKVFYSYHARKKQMCEFIVILDPVGLNEVMEKLKVGIHILYKKKSLQFIISGKNIQEIGPVLTPNKAQKKLSSKISFGSWIIYGKPGVGKSKLAKILAQKYKCNLLVISSNYLSIPNYLRIYNIIDKPLVILLDEIELDLFALLRSENPEDCKIMSSSKKDEKYSTKRNWNRVFDDLENYQNIILIMTSNVENLNELYKTETRTGRISGVLKME
jgi:hypothetical protein